MFLSTLPEKINPAHTALLVIDMQNDFCHPDGAVAQEGFDLSMTHAMLPALQRLVAAARAAGTAVVHIRVVADVWTRADAWLEQKQAQGFLPKCARGTWGAEFWGIEPAADERVVDKFRYSAFVGTELDFILNNRGIRCLIHTGVATNVCVETTLRDAFMHNFYVVLVSDATAAPTAAEHEATVHNVQRWFGVTATVDAIIAAWQASPKGGEELQR